MSHEHDILALIPARGGSKSIPHKNRKLFAGKPLIAWTIEAAQRSRYLKRILVSTDDEEIAVIAKRFGAEVPFLRPAHFAHDLSPTIDAVLHTLDWFRDTEHYRPSAVVLLPPTSPLRRVEDIDKGIETLLESPEADSVRPIIESPKHPYKTLRIEGEYLAPFFPADVTGFEEPYDMARQLFPPAYIYSGAMQIVREASLRTYRSLTGKKSRYFFMKPEHSINIDTPIDFAMAEFFLQYRGAP